MPHRVLVVDDEEAIRDLLHEYLESRGYRVIVAADGDEGIAAFESGQAQLALIDFLLPRKNGFAVADAIRRSSRPDTPIIMMSGVFKNPKTAVEAKEKYQVLDFLSKPLDLEELHQVIRSALVGIEPALSLAPPAAEAPARHASLVLENATFRSRSPPPGDRRASGGERPLPEEKVR